MPAPKLYCYVDETGQETAGRLFLVAIIVAGAADRDKLQDFLRRTEDAVGKHRKWHQTRFVTRDAYLRRVLSYAALRQNLFYAVHSNTQDYVQATEDRVALLAEPADVHGCYEEQQLYARKLFSLLRLETVIVRA